MNENVQAAFASYSDMKRDSRKWRAVMSGFILPCLAAFAIQKYAGRSVSVLAGKKAIRHYLTYNCAALGLMLITFAVFLTVFIRCVRKENNSVMKIFSFVGGGAVLIFTIVALSMSINHIASDYKSPSLCRPDEYVLSTSVSEGESCCYIGFEDKGEYTQLRIPENIYVKLSNREQKPDTDGSEIYNMIVDGGYSGAELYDGEDVEVSYYFYSAIFDSVKIKA